NQKLLTAEIAENSRRGRREELLTARVAKKLARDAKTPQSSRRRSGIHLSFDILTDLVCGTCFRHLFRGHFFALFAILSRTSQLEGFLRALCECSLCDLCVARLCFLCLDQKLASTHNLLAVDPDMEFPPDNVDMRRRVPICPGMLAV